MIKYLLFLSLTLSSFADRKPNILFILCDDHRWDALSLMGHQFIKTPHIDKLAKNGAHFQNAYVTTSLCSPSRASILTGLYAHNHKVIDNNRKVGEDLVFFPQKLQQAGYETAFIGKWHMGNDDSPQRGFDYWLAFQGQGTYYADNHGANRVVPQSSFNGFNINGKDRVSQKGYITDELTDYALKWLDERPGKEKPFFLYVSHKAVHSDFVGRDGERGKYKHIKWNPPVSMANTPENRAGKPRWVTDQRNSRHGMDFGYNLDFFNLEEYHKRYCEAITPVDDNVGRMVEYLKQKNELDNTIIVYTGDNGFNFGEHGLIDKRSAYEPSIHVPLIIHYPKKIKAGTKVKKIVANIDIAPTLLEAAGVNQKLKNIDGKSFWPMAEGRSIPWRESLLYEYYWEWNYPQTPSVFAMISEKYKFIRYHGVWDTDELYDMENDPHEMKNLYRVEEYKNVVLNMKRQLFDVLEKSNGTNVPFARDKNRQFYYRHPERSQPGDFPKWFYDKPAPVTE